MSCDVRYLCLEDTKCDGSNLTFSLFSTHDFVLFLRWANRCKIKTQRACNRRELWSTVINVHDSSEPASSSFTAWEEEKQFRVQSIQSAQQAEDFSLFSLSISYLIAREIIIIIIMLSESKRPNCWILQKKKRFFFDVLTRLIALLHSGQQQLHAFCKLEWAKSAIFCTRMTNFTEVLSSEFVTLLLWLAVFARLGHMSSWIRSWVGRICHVESAAGVCKFYPENFSCWISPKHANYRSETDSRKKLLMDSTRLIKFLRNFRETCVSRWIILILNIE